MALCSAERKWWSVVLQMAPYLESKVHWSLSCSQPVICMPGSGGETLRHTHTWRGDHPYSTSKSFLNLLFIIIMIAQIIMTKMNGWRPWNIWNLKISRLPLSPGIYFCILLHYIKNNFCIMSFMVAHPVGDLSCGLDQLSRLWFWLRPYWLVVNNTV